MLNTFQSNADAIEKARLERDKNAHLIMPNMRKFASRVGISVSTILHQDCCLVGFVMGGGLGYFKIQSTNESSLIMDCFNCFKMGK